MYDLKVDPATGKANAVATLARPEGRQDADRPGAAEPDRDRGRAAPSVGPIPLAGYEPGKYVVQLKVTDNVAKKDLVQEAPLEVLP